MQASAQGIGIRNKVGGKNGTLLLGGGFSKTFDFRLHCIRMSWHAVQYNDIPVNVAEPLLSLV